VRLLVRLLASAVALAVAAGLVDGISVGPGTDRERALTLLGVAIIFGLVNAIVRPILRLLTLPLVVLTLGLFLLVLNAFCLWLTSLIVPGFEVRGFKAAFLGALLITVVSWALTVFVSDSGRFRRHDRLLR